MNVIRGDMSIGLDAALCGHKKPRWITGHKNIDEQISSPKGLLHDGTIFKADDNGKRLCMFDSGSKCPLKWQEHCKGTHECPRYASRHIGGDIWLTPSRPKCHVERLRTEVERWCKGALTV